eukprot:TRINITY_DN2906_c0_g1_i1.p1 TRINITY_DN2906_c0_g1~~TRINITY_DN2906_c0_g1_i1.p1  ORF type:complete len:102 (+),score=13.21 TRINITY_DN2906_c0_g1_i1:133-438(+)
MNGSKVYICFKIFILGFKTIFCVTTTLIISNKRRGHETSNKKMNSQLRLLNFLDPDLPDTSEANSEQAQAPASSVTSASALHRHQMPHKHRIITQKISFLW